MSADKKSEEKPSSIVPKLRAEEEEEEEDEEDLVDPAEGIKEKCGEQTCSASMSKLTECNDRVNGKERTAETCMEELMDFYHCVDHCAAKEIFNHVK